MSALPNPTTWTVEQYLKFERQSETRHEFYGGVLEAMAGATERHNQIASALNYTLFGQVIDRPCEVFQADMRVRATETAYFYPDLVVVCGEATYETDHRDTLVNPDVIIEVLSPSTEDFDRGRKFAAYRAIDTLRDYILVAQETMHIEHYTLRPGEGWLLREYDHPDDQIHLPAIDCTVKVRDAYRKVRFEQGTDGSDDE